MSSGVHAERVDLLNILNAVLRVPRSIRLKINVVILGVSYYQLLHQFDPDLFSFELLVHEAFRKTLRRSLIVELLVYFARDCHKRAVDINLLEEVIFELTAAHKESLQDQEEALSTSLPM